jgi:membrane-bound lytic murein transglycosylase B
MKLRLFTSFMVLFVCLGLQNACTQAVSPDAGASGAMRRHHPGIAPVWLPLVYRLEDEGIGGPDVDAYFLALGSEITQDPMGRKVREIYRARFMRPPPDPDAPPRPPSRKKVYPGVVTEANALRCRDFLAAHPQYFARAQKLHGIPPEILVSLLFVETRLGTAIGGGNNALHTLASMAVSKKPEQIPDWLVKLPEDHVQRLDWIEDLMQKRSEWAYKEVKALVVYVRKSRLDMTSIPGSYYGAIGHCQFMPTNIEPYGVDSDGNGTIDLFSMGDAIASVANYLARHGWKPGLNREARHKVLRTYNHVDIYPNTILALSDLVNKQQREKTTKKSGKRS